MPSERELTDSVPKKSVCISLIYNVRVKHYGHLNAVAVATIPSAASPYKLQIKACR